MTTILEKERTETIKEELLNRDDAIISEVSLHMVAGTPNGNCSCVCISDCTCNSCLLQ
jgi:hypothetical protein